MRLFSLAILVTTSVLPPAHAQAPPVRIPDGTTARFQLDPQDSTWRTGKVRVVKGGCVMLEVKHAAGVAGTAIVGFATRAARLQVLYNRAEGWTDVDLTALRGQQASCDLPHERG